MATDIVSGLFGLAPYQIQQQRNQSLQDFANQQAQLNATQRGVRGMTMAGGQLAGAVAPMLGMVDPAMQQAQVQQQVMAQGGDIGTSKGLLAKAEQFRQAGDLRTAAVLTMKGKELEREEAKTALELQKQKFKEEQEFQLRKDAEANKMTLAREKMENTAEEKARDRASRLEMARLVASLKSGSTLTPAQQLKVKQAMAAEKETVRAVDTAYDQINALAEQIKTHPGLPAATGISGRLMSIPGGESAKVEQLLEEFKAALKLQGLNLSRQGGGIGAMTEKEWPIVEQMVAAIDPAKLGLEGTKQQINKAVAKASQIKKNARMKYADLFDQPLDDVAPAAPAAQGYGAPPPGAVRLKAKAAQ